MLESIRKACANLNYDPSVDPERIPAYIDLGPHGRLEYIVDRVEDGRKIGQIRPTDPMRTAYFVPVDKGAPMPKAPFINRAFAATAVAAATLGGAVLGACIVLNAYVGIGLMTASLVYLGLTVYCSPKDPFPMTSLGKEPKTWPKARG